MPFHKIFKKRLFPNQKISSMEVKLINYLRIVLYTFGTLYRPGQHNWEYTMFQDFSAAQILHEINVGHFEALNSKNCHF